MAFNPGNLVQWNAPSPAPHYGLPQWWGYLTTDTIATVEAADYFDLNPGNVIGRNTVWFVGDQIYCVCADGVVELQIAAITPHVTTTAGNANIPAGSITNAMLGANIVQSGNLDATTIQYIKVPMSAAQWNGMYAAPFEIIPAPGAGKAIIVKSMTAAMTFVAAQYAAGGAVILQYDSAVNHGAGLNTCGTTTEAAATVNGFAASTSFGFVGQTPLAGIANASFVNKNVALSNATGAFTTGDGTWNIHAWYSIVTL